MFCKKRRKYHLRLVREPDLYAFSVEGNTHYNHKKDDVCTVVSA